MGKRAAMHAEKGESEGPMERSPPKGVPAARGNMWSSFMSSEAKNEKTPPFSIPYTIFDFLLPVLYPSLGYQAFYNRESCKPLISLGLQISLRVIFYNRESCNPAISLHIFFAYFLDSWTISRTYGIFGYQVIQGTPTGGKKGKMKTIKKQFIHNFFSSLLKHYSIF